MGTSLHSKVTAPASTQPSLQGSSAWGKWFAIAVFIYLAIASFPQNIFALSDSIDGQLLWNLHFLAHSAYIYGRDILFVYGPLGYLQYPLHIGWDLELSTIISTTLHASLGVAAYLLLANGARSPFRAVLFAALIFLCAQYPSSTECDISQLTCTIAYLPLVAPALAIPLAAILGALSAFTIFVKFNAGVGSIVLSLAAALCWWLKYKRQSITWAAAALGSFLLTLAILSVILLKSFPNVLLWLSGMREIASGYSETHSLLSSSSQPLWAMLIAAACFGFLIYLWRSKSELTLPALVTCILFLFAYKHSIVRQDDDHLLFLATTIPVGLAYLSLISKSRKETAVLVCLLSGSLIMFSQWHLQMQRSWDNYYKYITCQTGLENIMVIAQWQKTLADVDALSRETIAHWHLPPKAVAAIGKGSVDVVPTERLYPLADHLTWRPNPVLNFYMAQTPYLDALTGAHFSGPNAPDFLLASLIDIDYRHPFYCAPLAWRAILDNYHSLPVNKALSKDWSILSVLALGKNKATPDTLTPLPQGTVGTIGSWIDVPACAGMLYGKFEMKRTIFGAVSAILYQIPPAWIDLQFASGRKESYRFVPSQSKNGLLLNYLPNTLADLDRLFHHQANDKISRFRVRIPGGRLCFERSLHIQWLESSIPISVSSDTQNASR
jgi:hypothetical protein